MRMMAAHEKVPDLQQQQQQQQQQSSNNKCLASMPAYLLVNVHSVFDAALSWHNVS
jgi:hypothetical protein